MFRLFEPSQGILYTFRRCPYAIRARLAIFASGVNVAMYEVDLRNKPDALLACSPKGTVPVLYLTNGTVIDESVDIMQWALAINDPFHWRVEDVSHTTTSHLIQQNDGIFKFYLDRYKYAERFPAQSRDDYRQQAAQFLVTLTEHLHQHRYLISDQPTVADIAIFPFVRQFAQVDRIWFDNATEVVLRDWLARLLQSPLFLAVMKREAVGDAK